MTDITRDDIIAAYPLSRLVEEQGIELAKIGGRIMCKCPFHADGTPSMSLNFDENVWNCFAGCGGGSSIDFIAKLHSEDPLATFKRLANELKGSSGVSRPKPAPMPVVAKKAPESAKPKDSWPVPGKDKPSKVYAYTNAFGRTVYEVLRFERPNTEKSSGYEKTFRQRHEVDGKQVYSMEGVERVLYRLPEVLSSPVVWVVEGEKDADNLSTLGFQATCNVGGAGKWMEGYTDSLTGKDIVICGDNDKPGKEHAELVFETVSKKVRSVRIIRLPEAVKDASDFIATFPDTDKAKAALTDLFNSATPFVQGHKLPLYTMEELEQRYMAFIQRSSECAFGLGSWIPAFNPLRKLVPGDLVAFLAGTGVGKTAIFTNIARAARPLQTLFFELELPDARMFERFIGAECDMHGYVVEEGYRNGDTAGAAAINNRLGHIAVCTESGLSASDIESIIIRSELKTGRRPAIVLVDYIQLMRGSGKTRYEKISSAAEDLKGVAKATQTIIFVTSQIQRRKEDDSPEVGLSDGKESGSIENSAGLVIGAWRDDESPADTMIMRVLKATSGGSGLEVRCHYDTKSLRISQKQN